MLRSEVARVANFTENRNECFQRGSPESGKPSSESTFSSSAIEFYSCAIPLPCGGGVGRGVVVVERRASTNTDPHPQPLPTRGRGAHRVCGTFMDHLSE